ncbi:MAG: hypothetical protein H7061_00380 [Bdellovibrionaceae bacterium]|nr:hypothetical protein [Bdellovibrio sp.]
MNLMKTFVILAISLTSLASFAWREGNGGDGILMNSKMYLLDLVENGVEEANSSDIAYSNSFFEKEVKSWADAQAVEVPQREIVNKLGEIHRKNSVMAYVILLTIKKLDWAFVNLPLKNIKDEGPYNISLQNDLVQLAIRVNKTIQVYKVGWKQMDARNQTALIFHEAIFSLVNPDRTELGLSMSAPRVRRIIGFLFSQKIETYSLDEMLSIEAPELRLQAYENKPMNVSYFFAAKSELLLNAHWALQVQTAQGETTLLNESGLSESNLINTQKVCGLVSEAGSVVSLQLIADQLKLSLRTNGQKENEDYNFANTFTQNLNVMTLILENNFAGDNCVLNINKNKKAILKQILK